MNEKYTSKNSTFKKILSFILAIIIGFGTFFTMTVISSDFSKKLRIGESLTAYASYIENFNKIDNLDIEAMKNNPYIIELVNSDGTHTIYQYSEPVTYTDNVNELHIKDTKIVEQDDKTLESEGYFYTNQENDIDIDFSKMSNNGTNHGRQL